MFDLRNKNIYVGNQEVLKGYVGTNLLYNSVDLVFPDPPTEYYTENLKLACFFGGGVEHIYKGSSFTAEGDYSIEPNGLRLNGGRAYAYTNTSYNRDGIAEITIENSFNHMEPGDSQMIFYFTNASNFGGGSLFVRKKKDGVYLSMGNSKDFLVPDTDFIHICVQFNADLYDDEYTYYMYLHVNGSLLLTTQSRRTNSRYYMGEIYATGDILVYDIKFYEGYAISSITPKTNYNGIKDLPFVRTDQL